MTNLNTYEGKGKYNGTMSSAYEITENAKDALFNAARSFGKKWYAEFKNHNYNKAINLLAERLVVAKKNGNENLQYRLETAIQAIEDIIELDC